MLIVLLFSFFDFCFSLIIVVCALLLWIVLQFWIWVFWLVTECLRFVGLVGDLGLGWFVVVVAGVWCGFMVGLRGLLLLMHDTLSGWLAVDFLVDLEVGFCCCCLSCFVLWVLDFLWVCSARGILLICGLLGGWFWVFALCVWVSLFHDCLRLTLVNGFLWWALCVVAWVL